MNNYRQPNNIYGQQNNNNNNNRLINEYNNNSQRNMPIYNNNPMLNNNPRFSNFIQENSFQDRINIAKIEKLKKAQNFRDLGMNQQELISYVINPIKIEKLEKKEKEELVNKYYDHVQTYESLGKYSMDKKDTKTNMIVPKEIADLWNNRKNNPYKNILQFLDIKDYTNKDYKKNSDLIIHKTTQLDKIADTHILIKELKKLEKLLFTHDKELKTIYSDNRKKKFLEKFEYENKFKNKIKYDPKDCSQLKNVYKQEQKKISKQNKRIDDMIELLLASEDLSKEDIDEIKKIQEIEEKQSQKYEQAQEFIDREEKSKHNIIEKELEKEIEKEIGKKEFKKLMNELEQNINNDTDGDVDVANSIIGGAPKENKKDSTKEINELEKIKNLTSNIKDKYSSRNQDKNIHQDPSNIDTQTKNKKITIIKKNIKNDNDNDNNDNDNNDVNKDINKDNAINVNKDRKELEAKLASLRVTRYKNR